ncbi:MAG: substrate-binding domain-containing protein [Oscillospiraceae bacterium]|nr:substrate-binding domain-containing protein [Oscillospiraceae bacterium]
MRRRMIICVVLVALVLALAGYFTKGILFPNVGVCLSGVGSAAGQELGKALRDKLTLSGFTVTSRNSGDDREKQIQQVKELLEKGVDALVLQPVSEDVLAEILPLAAETPVVVVGTEPENLGNAYFIGCDKDQQARAQAQLVGQMFAKADINGDRMVKYMLLTGLEEDPEAVRYVQNVEEVLSTVSASVLQKAAVELTEEAGKNACKQAISKYGRDLELIFCGDSALTVGAVEAVKSSGRTPGRDVIIFGVGSLEDCRELVRTGALTAAVVEDMDAIRDQIVQAVRNLTGGKETAKKTYVEHIVLTIENIDNH